MKSFRRRPLTSAVQAATFAGSLSLAAAPALAGFDEVTTSNPFSVLDSGTEIVSLVLEDFDNDGDREAVVFHDEESDAAGFEDNDVSFYENIGTAAAPSFEEVQDRTGSYGGGGSNFAINPFASAWYGYGYGHPVSSGDLDGDDDADFIGGASGSAFDIPSGGITDSDIQGVATGLTSYHGNYSSNPFYGSGLTTNANAGNPYAGVLLVDLDNDSDMDVVVTDFDQIRVYRNNGLDGYGVMQGDELTGANNPFYAGDASNLDLTTAYYGAPLAAGDVDNDGDTDIVMGVRFGPADMRLFRNTGSAGTPQFEEVTGEDVNVGVSLYAAPVMADMDADGDDDLVVVDGQASGSPDFRYFENDGATAGVSFSGSGSGSFGLGGLLIAAFVGWFRRRR